MEIEENISVAASEGISHPDQSTVAPQAEPGPDNPPWSSGTAVAVWIASVLFIIFIPGFFLLPYLLSLTPPITETEQIVEYARTDATSIFIQIAAIIPAHVLTLLLAWLVVTRGRQFSVRKTVGLDKGGFVWWHYCIILGAFLALAAVVGTLFPEQEHDMARILRSSRYVVFIVAFVATFTAPVAEEIVYRGVLYSAFQRTFGVAAAFVLVTLLFVVVHVPQYYPSFSTIGLLTLLSVILTWIRMRAGNLLPCIILHTLFNALQSVFLILEPVLPSTEGEQPVSTFLDLLR